MAATFPDSVGGVHEVKKQASIWLHVWFWRMTGVYLGRVIRSGSPYLSNFEYVQRQMFWRGFSGHPPRVCPRMSDRWMGRAGQADPR
jgi:hypothetical protein